MKSSKRSDFFYNMISAVSQNDASKLQKQLESNRMHYNSANIYLLKFNKRNSRHVQKLSYRNSKYNCQRVQTLTPTNLKQFYSNPRRPTCSPNFHTIHCTLQPQFPSPHLLPY